MFKGLMVCSDLHFKRFPNSPYNKGLDKLLRYFLEKYADYVWVFTGDFFDDDVMHYGVITHAVKLLDMHDKPKYIVTGNHELGNYGNILAPLRYSKINIEYEHKIRTVGDYKVQFFPYLPKVRDMKIYENCEDESDITISHFALPGQNFGNLDEIKLKCKAKICHINGHIHLPFQSSIDDQIYLTPGVPQCTRNLEQHHKPQIVRIEDGKYNMDDLPVYFTIEDLKFGEKPKYENSIINVIDAPSMDVVRMEYKDFNVREEGVKLKRTEIDVKSKVENVLHKDIDIKWITWATENKKSKEVMDAVSSYLI